jgi:hypothetical protein
LRLRSSGGENRQREYYDSQVSVYRSRLTAWRLDVKVPHHAEVFTIEDMPGM